MKFICLLSVTKDMEKSRHFYTEILGLGVISDYRRNYPQRLSSIADREILGRFYRKTARWRYVLVATMLKSIAMMMK